MLFSKDRPLQLDAALRSLKLDCDDLDPASIHVLFRTSTPFFASQYRVLANQHPDVVFIREQQFKADLLRLLEGTSYVLFVVDDTLLVGRFSLAQAVRVLESNTGCLGVSLRLGRNTRYCYTVDKPQQLPEFEEVDPDLLSFDWTQAEHDFGYPLELSSSIYRTEDLVPLLTELDCRDPNTLEAALAARAAAFRDTRPRLASYPQSVAFSVPANLVQTAWQNRVDGRPELSAAALGDAFSRGQRLDVQRYQGFVPNACHQEVDFLYASDPDVPTVSVVTRCYKQSQYLPEAVESLVAQTFDDWELIIVDDGSPDETARVAQALIDLHADRRIRLLRGPNRGLSGALNAGIEVALGRYILPLDADDMIAPEMLAQTVQVLETRPGVAVAYVQYRQFGEGTVVQRLHAFDRSLLLNWDYVPYCSLFRSEVWQATGGYSAAMTWGYEDWDFWLSAVEIGYRMQRLPQVLFKYRVRTGSMYSVAQKHDSEIRALLRRRHPRLFTPRRRAMARLEMAGLEQARRMRRGLRRIRILVREVSTRQNRRVPPLE